MAWPAVGRESKSVSGRNCSRWHGGDSSSGRTRKAQLAWSGVLLCGHAVGAGLLGALSVPLDRVFQVVRHASPQLWEPESDWPRRVYEARQPARALPAVSPAEAGATGRAANRKGHAGYAAPHGLGLWLRAGDQPARRASWLSGPKILPKRPTSKGIRALHVRLLRI